jgi:3'(2'), 5'-bisphosphate nucleotidase
LEKEFCWIVDPLDGTKEFIKMNDEFSINIALTKERKVVMGLIYMPVFDELYYAVQGEGAYTIGPTGNKRRIHVSKRTHRLRVLKSRSHHLSRYNEMLEANKDKIAVSKCAGSAYKGCLIAKGDFDIYYNYGKTMVWDTASMDLIVTEAGGFFAQGDGSLFEYNVKNTANKKGFMILNKKENCLQKV